MTEAKQSAATRPLVVVPVLAAAQSTERILLPLGARSSLERTLSAALSDLPEATVVVSTDSDAVAEQAQALDPRVVIHHRSAEDYVSAIVETLDANPDEIVVILEPTHPFRPRGLVARTANNLAERDHLDSVVCVRRFEANLWRAEPGGSIAALGAGGPGQGDTYYREMVGLALATRPSLLRDGRRLGDAVGFEVLDQFWALVDIRDDVSLAVAEVVADRLTEIEDRIS